MIGVFDSGVGGLTILTEIHERLPGESLIYFADQAYNPYGNLSEATIVERSEWIIRFLIKQGATMIVIACNTATASAIDSMRQRFSLPIVGVEPGIKPAALNSQTRKIGILATENTVASNRYLALMQRFVPEVEVISQPCRGLADAIEIADSNIPALLDQYVQPLLDQQIDHLVLGCTHYPLVTEQLAPMVEPDVTLVDTSEAVAMEVERRLPGKSSNLYCLNLFSSRPDNNLQQVIQAYPRLQWLADTTVQIATKP